MSWTTTRSSWGRKIDMEDQVDVARASPCCIIAISARGRDMDGSRNETHRRNIR